MYSEIIKEKYPNGLFRNIYIYIKITKKNNFKPEKYFLEIVFENNII